MEDFRGGLLLVGRVFGVAVGIAVGFLGGGWVAVSGVLLAAVVALCQSRYG